jgi:putative colanic acid biosynthesis UDP-glucose lipid carrier transferase
LRNAPQFTFVLKLVDAACIAGVLYVLTLIYQPIQWDVRFSLLALIALGAFYFISEIGGVYQSWRGVHFRSELFRLFIVWSTTVLFLLALGYITKTSVEFSRLVISLWFVGTPVAMAIWRGVVRLLLRHFRLQGYNSRSVAIVGAGQLGVQIASVVKESPWLGLRFQGFYDDRAFESDRLSWDGELEGTFHELVEKSRRGEIDLIYITLPLTAQHRIMELIDQLADSTACVYMVPEFSVFTLFHGQWSNLEGIPMVSVFDTPFWGVDGWLKRTQDFVLASLILLLISVPMVLIAAAVKLSSPGPVFFRQKRYGMDGQEILVWKFRSMRVMEDGDKIRQATKGDPRVTPLGGFLRRTSLDELPQFINVLMGDMSIVGPRPHAVAHNEEYRAQIKGYMLRHAVKPGITGWAQINGWRGETDTLTKMEKRIEHDLWYIRNWSFWLDIKIVLLTVLKGFSGKFAY